MILLFNHFRKRSDTWSVSWKDVADSYARDLSQAEEDSRIMRNLLERMQNQGLQQTEQLVAADKQVKGLTDRLEEANKLNSKLHSQLERRRARIKELEKQLRETKEELRSTKKTLAFKEDLCAEYVRRTLKARRVLRGDD